MALDFLNDTHFTPEDDAQFRQGAAYPSLLWYSQLPTEDGETVNGWCIPLGSDFDEFAQGCGGKRVTIVHDNSNQDSRYPSQPRPDGKPSNYKDYWTFQTLDLFLLIKGMKDPMCEQGIVSFWTNDGKAKSHMKLCVLVKNFLEAGYSVPFILSMSGKGRTRALYQILQTQQTVLQAYKDYAKKQSGKTPALPMWAFSIPVGKGKVTAVQGNDPNTRPKNMVLPEAKTPSVIDEVYFKTHYVTQCALGKEAVDILRGTVEDTVQWAISTQADATSQKQTQAGSAQVDDESGLPDEVDASPATSNGQSQGGGKPAVDGQRNALRNLAKKPGNEHLADLADIANLTFEEAKEAITKAQAPKTPAKK